MRIRDWDRNLKVRLFGESLMNLTFWMFFPFLTIYFTEAFGKTAAGVLLITSQVFSVFANLLGGFYADRYGRKKMMVISSIGQGAAFLIFGFSNSPWLHSATVGFICFTVASIFGSFYYPASQAMVADVVNEKDRSHVFAVFYTSVNISVVVGPILGSIFFTYYRFQLLTVTGIICIFLGFLLFKFTRETAPEFRAVSPATRQHWTDVLKKQFHSYGIILKDRIFTLFIFGGVLVAMTFMQLDLILPVFTKEEVDAASLIDLGSVHLSLTGQQLFGFILSENGLLVALFTVIITRWAAKFPEKRIFILSSLSYAVSIYLFGELKTGWGLIFAMIIFSFGELVVTGIQQTFVSHLSPEHMRGQYFAASSLRYTIGRTIAPISIPLASWIGYQGTFLILALLAAASACVYLLMFKKLDLRKRSLQ
ncbi:MDR family MFS transporter [Heyndrickxia acidicola]|uniref:MFS transporter n=1 Tax=Heyndrickxia acidicola TaxID=209389 RepID=A0ABU6MC77_9BACI|nr:MFS transporter [Heyndrickxia acidicola]MED1202271.1 MFS transporter [Heyndrickxia acidicola]